MSRLPEIQVFPAALIFRRKLQLPLLHALKPDIYGVTPSQHEGEASESLSQLDMVVREYSETGTPFVVINMGLPKSGKTTLAGEELAFVSRKLQDQLFRRGGRREDIRTELAYIPYESIQQLVEQREEVPTGHGPGNQTLQDHRISSATMMKEVASSLAVGQNVILEAPFMGGRGEFADISALVTHTGPFARLTYNAKLFWPIPDNLHGVFTMMMRGDFVIRDRALMLEAYNVRVHTDDRHKISVPGADEMALRRNFYPDVAQHLRQLYKGLADLGIPEVRKYSVLFDSSPRELSVLMMQRFLSDTAPAILNLLHIPPSDAVVGINALMFVGNRVDYYDGLLRYFNKFRNFLP